MDSTNDTAGLVFGRDISERGFRHGLVWLLLLGLIVRAGFLVEHAHNPSFGVLTLDQKYFDGAARMILAGEDLRQLHGLRPLLYPMFLAACDKVGGTHGIDLAVAAQHFFGVLTGLMAALLGARLFRHRLGGLAGGALYLLAPVPLYFEGELLVESAYTFLICVGLLLAVRAAGAAGWRGGLLWLLCGAWMALTAQARPNILVFMAVYPLLAGWRWWRARRGQALLPLLGLLGAAAMAVPWGFVNKMQAGRFQVIPSAGGINLYFGNRRGADGMEPEQGRRVTYGEQYEDSGEVWAREEYESATRAAGQRPEANPMAVSRYWTHRAVDEIKADPAAWLGLMAKKCWLLFWNAEIPNNKSFAFLQTEYAWLRFLPVRWVVLLALAPAGIWAAAKAGRRGALFILLGYILLYCGANTLFFICDRYRYPVWPAMAALGGGGALAFIEAVRRRSGAALGMAAGMALLAALSLPDWFQAQLPSFARDYLFRSIAWYEKGHLHEALADVDRSLELDPGETTALHQRGNILLAQGRWNEARQDYERILPANSQDAALWNDYGLALDGLGLTDRALAAFESATHCHPPSRNAFFGAAFEAIKLGHPDQAAAVLDKFDRVEKGPDATALAIRSALARRRGDTAQADALETRARALDPAATAWALGIIDRKSFLVGLPR